MRAALLIVTLVAAAAGPARAAGPVPGRYDALLCVGTRADAALTCGAADVELRTGGVLSVRVADIVYVLAQGPRELVVATLHGPMTVDEFRAPFEWSGGTLRFSDTAKAVRYEVRLGARSQAR